MTRITLQDIKVNLGVTNTYDIVNAIRNSSGDGFKNYVPLATADNVAEVGAGIMINQTVQNEFIANLVDRIGKVVVHQTSLKNQLKKFKKGNFPLGRTIEEIFTDITKAKRYDPEDAETTVFRRTVPNVKTLFHERSRQDVYEQTIQDESLKMAFTTWDNLGSFMASILNAVYNSAEVDEYEYMKLLIDNYYSKGLFTVVPVTVPDTETGAKEFVKKLRATAYRMTLPTGTRDYNSLAVRTRSEMSDLHLLIDSELRATLDVDVLASAFNMDKTDFMGHVTVIDGFASSGLEAVLVDKDFFMVYDNLFKMETIRNPKGLYWNYFLHVWQTLSVSRFANAVAFVTGNVKKVTQVIVDPTILAIKPEKTHQFTAYVRTTVKEDFPVTWKVTAQTGSTLSAGTTISADGLLTVGAQQTGTLSVTASVNRGTSGTPELVTGESIVTVVPKLN